MPKTEKTRCASGACVDVKADGRGGFTFTSTIDGNDGAVTYTRAEVETFLTDVKAGDWDHLIA